MMKHGDYERLQRDFERGQKQMALAGILFLLALVALVMCSCSAQVIREPVGEPLAAAKQAYRTTANVNVFSKGTLRQAGDGSMEMAGDAEEAAKVLGNAVISGQINLTARNAANQTGSVLRNRSNNARRVDMGAQEVEKTRITAPLEAQTKIAEIQAAER